MVLRWVAVSVLEAAKGLRRQGSGVLGPSALARHRARHLVETSAFTRFHGAAFGWLQGTIVRS